MECTAKLVLSCAQKTKQVQAATFEVFNITTDSDYVKVGKEAVAKYVATAKGMRE